MHLLTLYPSRHFPTSVYRLAFCTHNGKLLFNGLNPKLKLKENAYSGGILDTEISIPANPLSNWSTYTYFNQNSHIDSATNISMTNTNESFPPNPRWRSMRPETGIKSKINFSIVLRPTSEANSHTLTLVFSIQ